MEQERALQRLRDRHGLVLGLSNLQWNSLLVAFCFNLWGDPQSLKALIEDLNVAWSAARLTRVSLLLSAMSP
jgi:hypothetical protein